MASRGRPQLAYRPPETDLPELLGLWNRALQSEKGIKIASNSPHNLLGKLYKARREAGHNSYRNLKLVETQDSVWILPR